MGPFFCELFRGCEADAIASAGDECNFTFKSLGHCSSPLLSGENSPLH
jgi:hypothetical protein